MADVRGEAELEREIRSASSACREAQAVADAAYALRRNLWLEARNRFGEEPIPYARLADWAGVSVNAVIKTVKREPES